MGKRMIIAFAFIAVLFVAGCEQLQTTTTEEQEFEKLISLPKFQSCQAISEEIEKARKEQTTFWEDLREAVPVAGVEKAAESIAPAVGIPDYSTTNIQVEGVDEADIVKTDGEYIYVIANNKFIIAKAYPPESAKILAVEQLKNFYPQEMFIHKNKVMIFGSANYNYPTPIVGGPEKQTTEIAIMPPYRRYMSIMSARIYDTANKENPKLEKSWEFEGSYVSSRKIDEWVYFVVNSYPYYYYNTPKPMPVDIVPLYREVEGDTEMSETKFNPIVECSEIHYIKPIRPENFITVAAVSMKDTKRPIEKEVIMGSGQNIYASLENLYIAQTWWDYRYMPVENYRQSNEKTIVYKFELNDGKINYKNNGIVPGTILNQFSMDEYKGNFRIATTTGQVWTEGGVSTNNVYILDKDMDIVGRLEGLAPGERIYSTRFMGNRGYMVTFRNIDPLFALDLSDPEDPKVLGKLKIPGYSDYLHPYDENHIIGIGKDTEESDAGDFAWYQGMKMAIFDVTDVENPKQIHKVLIGDRGTDSPVLHNHKALLFDKEKELLVIPILVAQIKDKESVEEWSYGEYIYQGAYVFKINLKEGFVLRGKITHYDEDSFGKGRYFYGDQRSIERSLYIDNVLYTVSQKSIQLNDLDDLNFIKKLDFKQQVEEEEEEIIY